MANPNSSTNAIQNATPSIPLGPCHIYDNWLMPEAVRNNDAVFAAKVMDIAAGARVIASIMAGHVLDLNAIARGSADTRTLLSEPDTEALARLAVVALDELHTLATNRVDQLNTKAQKGAGA